MSLWPDWRDGCINGVAINQIETALAGLTPEQVVAIPRLIALYTWPIAGRTGDWNDEADAMRKIFPRRES